MLSEGINRPATTVIKRRNRLLSGKYPLTTTGATVSFVPQSTFDDKENKKVKKIKKLATVSSTGSLRQYIGGLA